MLFCRSRLAIVFAAAALLLASSACSDDTHSASDSGVDGPGRSDGPFADASPRADGPATDVLPGCVFEPGAADRDRVVVISRPYDDSFAQVGGYEVMHLSSNGTLSRPNLLFSMERAFEGEILFSADGHYGYVAQDDGSIGIFRVEADRSVVVLNPSFDPGFYVSRLVMGPEGRRLFGLSTQWRESGGGIYQLQLGCDGQLTNLGLLAASKLPYDVEFLSSSLAVVAARDVLDSTAGHDLHLVSFATVPDAMPASSVLAGVDAFGDDDNSVADMAVTGDQRYALVADTSLIAGDRIAVVDLGQAGSTSMSTVQLLSYSTPNAVLFSPFNNAALVLGVEANRVTVLDYTPDAAKPFSERGRLAASTPTLLPGNAVVIRRGTLEGHVFIAENVTLRQVRFLAAGGVEEVDAVDFGEGGTAIVGAVGVQP